MRSTNLLRTTTFQLTLLYMGLFGLSAVILLAFIYWSSIGYLQRQTDATIAAEIEGLSEQYRQRGLDGLARVITSRIESDPNGRSVYLFANQRSMRLAGNLTHWPNLTETADGWYAFTFERGDVEIPARAMAFSLRGDLRLLVGRDVRDLQEIGKVFRRALLWGGGITLALALLGGLMMSWSVRRRVDAINVTSREIMRGNLARRMPSRGTGDEFDELAENLNRMLDQIESLMGSVQHVADNVAHDLRTPLTRLRNRLEGLSNRASDTERGQIEAALTEADGLLNTFRGLLRIARIEAGSYEGSTQAVALAEIARDAIDLYQAVAEEQGLSLTLDAPPTMTVNGDRDLLFQALVNLLDNAIKYTPAGGRVHVVLDENAGRVRLRIQDSGPGIPPALRERVMERFFRLDSSRNTPGDGLGLSLVKAVALRHEGWIALGDAQPGLSVELNLPAVDHVR